MMRSVMTRTAAPVPAYGPAEGARPFPWPRMALLGLLAYGFFVLLWAPASQPWSWVERQFPQLSLDPGPATVWVGEARPLRVAGREELSVSWRFDPFALFAARLGYRVALEGTDLVLDGKLGWRPWGDVVVTHGHVDMALERTPAWFGLTLPPMFAPLGGDAVLDVAGLALHKGWPVAMEKGGLALHGLSLGQLDLGDWRGRLQLLGEGGTLSMALVPVGDRLQGSLDVRLDRSAWSVELALKPGADSSDLSGTLALLGARDARGFYRGRFEGRWL